MLARLFQEKMCVIKIFVNVNEEDIAFPRVNTYLFNLINKLSNPIRKLHVTCCMLFILENRTNLFFSFKTLNSFVQVYIIIHSHSHSHRLPAFCIKL